MQIGNIAVLGLCTALVTPGITLVTPAFGQSQRMAIPSYYYPGQLWQKAASGAPTVGMEVINPNSGPGTSADPAYQTQVKVAQASGLAVLCYVNSGYGKRDPNQVAQDLWHAFSWYGVNGIFFDQVPTDAADVNTYVQWRVYIKSLNSKAIVVLDASGQPDEGYMQAGNIICNFAGDYNSYQTGYTPIPWASSYPANRFWHIIFNVPTDTQMRDVVAESKQRHAGWVYVTPVGLPNPFGALPADTYWLEEIKTLKAP